MGVKVWVYLDAESGELYILDRESYGGGGPIEISNELFERIMEHDLQHQMIQGIMQDLVYDWQHPDDDPEMDCE